MKLTPYRVLEMKIFAQGNKRLLERRVFHVGPGQVFNDAGIDRAVDATVDYLDQTYPGQDFRLVKLSGGRFNFINITGETPQEEILFETDVKER